ncbi:MAG: hypothetical protein RIT45_3351 [Pseudomonadota bacterium]|jgi:proteasome lid subunit RPN8/RPN11
MTTRDPIALLQRFGRQLLVEGVSAERQAGLARWCVALATDGSDSARLAAEVAMQYCVGAGVGRVCLADAALDGLDPRGLDASVELVGAEAATSAAAVARPPAAHLYFATRRYGASVDLLLVDDDAGWDVGASHDAVVATVVVELGDPEEGDAEAGPEDAPSVGTLAARLLVSHLLGLEPLPAVLHLRWPDGDADPEVHERAPSESGAEVADLAEGSAPPGLLAELRRTPAALDAILDHARKEYPNEACGFVVRDSDGSLRAVPTRNLQDRYHAIDPESYPRTSRTAFKLDERVILREDEAGHPLQVIFHTHCEAGAYFSAEDARAAAPGGEPIFPDAGHLVLSVMGGEVRALALFRFDAASGRFVPELGGGPLQA